MGLYKRNKTWWMSLSYQGKQIRRTTGTENKKLAEAILSKIKISIVEGRHFDILEEKERTFDEMIERYLLEHLSKKPSRESGVYFKNNLTSFFTGLTLAEITPKKIVDYKLTRYKDGVSPATINRELGMMKAAYNLAIKEWEWCRTNPVNKISMEKENNKRDRWITSEEEKELLRVSSQWVKDLILFALNTGMRRGEILSLTRKGVDLNRKTVTVFFSKNGERRTIPINQTVLELLKRKLKIRSIKTDLIFHSSVFTPINKDNLRRSFNLSTKKAEIENLHFHDLRHTFATRLVQAGIDLYKVQKLLGHKTPAMTQRYAHHCPESLREGVIILDNKEKVITNLSQPPLAQGGHSS